MPLSLLLVLILPLLTGALCWVMRRPPRVEQVHIAGALGTLITGLALAFEVFVGGPARVGAFHDLLYVDALGVLLIVVVAVVCCLAAFYSVGYLRLSSAITMRAIMPSSGRCSLSARSTTSACSG
jgi:formate hydrogenlyase subunit 3/multisubunit Na+/H+ antiporter MnhD subunit